MKAIKYILGLVTLCCITFGCNKHELEVGVDAVTFFADLSSAPYVPVSKEDLPEWLVIKIDMYEFISNSMSIFVARIFKGEWRKQTVYFIRDSGQSCQRCDFFYEDGSSLGLSYEEKIVDFYVKSKNWVLIYEIGNKEWMILLN